MLETPHAVSIGLTISLVRVIERLVLEEVKAALPVDHTRLVWELAEHRRGRVVASYRVLTDTVSTRSERRRRRVLDDVRIRTRIGMRRGTQVLIVAPHIKMHMDLLRAI